MTDQDFQNRIFEALSGIESRLEKRLDTIETQRKGDNDRLEKRLDSLDTRLDSLNSRLGTVEHDVGWIKGKLEGKQKSSSEMSPIFISIGAAIAVIIALIALFT